MQTMKISGKRKCDVCGSVIPAKTTFRVAMVPRDGLAMFLNLADSDLQPTWTEVGDGTGRIRLDICAACNSGMGATEQSA